MQCCQVVCNYFPFLNNSALKKSSNIDVGIATGRTLDLCLMHRNSVRLCMDMNACVMPEN